MTLLMMYMVTIKRSIVVHFTRPKKIFTTTTISSILEKLGTTEIVRNLLRIMLTRVTQEKKRLFREIYECTRIDTGNDAR